MRSHRSRRKAAIATALLACAVVAVATPPASAAVTSISPSAVTVDPGGGASATVTVRSEAVSCLTVRSSDGSVDAGVSRECDAGDWTTTLSVRTAPDTAPGTYSVRVADNEGGQTLTVRVRAPAPDPPPPPPTTTTTAPTTTTRRTTTTRSPAPADPAPPPESAPTTTAEEPPAGATPEPEVPPAPDPAAAFVDVPEMIDAGIPDIGVFLPLVGEGFRRCLPLIAACGDASAGVVVVPARTSQIVWRQAPEEGAATPVADLVGLGLAPVGAPPDDAAAAAFTVLVVDEGTRVVVRRLSPEGVLAAGDTGGAAPLAAFAAGPLVPIPPAADEPTAPEDAAPTRQALFGRPAAVRSSTLTEAAPALVVLGDTNRLLHGVVPDPRWGVGVELLAFFDGRTLPYLARRVEGPPGLFLATPAGADLATPATRAGPERPPGGGGVSPLGLLAGAVVVGTALLVAAARRGRRSHDDGHDLQHQEAGLSRPPGT